MQQTFKNSNHL